jgi:hypothetical protein
VKRLGGGDKPWVGIMRALVDGRLRAHLIPGDRRSLTTMLGVEGAHVLASLADWTGVGDAAAADSLNHHEAADLLGVNEPMVAALVAAGLLTRSDRECWGVRRQDAVAFQQTYVMTGELAARLNVRARDVRARLAACGLQPLASLTRSGGFVWWRADVDRVLAAGPPPGCPHRAAIPKTIFNLGPR